MKRRIGTNLKKSVSLILSAVLLAGTLGVFALPAFNDAEAAAAPLSWGYSRIGVDEFMRDMPEENLPAVTVAVLDTGAAYDLHYIKDRLLPGYDFVNNDADATDDDNVYFGRGTHITSTIVNMTLENVKILPVKVIAGDGTLPSNETLYNAVKYAADNGADIINIGFSYSTKDKADYDAWEAAIKYATDRDVLCVATAGNNAKSFDDCLASGTYIVPAMNTDVLTVGSSDEDDVVLHNSNFGSHMELVAPGEKIQGYLNSGKLGYLSGPNIAASFVSSCAALMLTKNNTMTYKDVYEELCERAADRDELGKDIYYGYGRVHIGNVTYVSSPRFKVEEEHKHIYLKTQNAVPFSYPDSGEPYKSEGGFVISFSNPEVAGLEKRTGEMRNTLVGYSAGETTVTATYVRRSNGETAQVSYTVHVYDEERPEMRIKTLPDRLEYNIYERIDTTGMSLELTYSDGSKETITEGFTCTPESLIHSGITTVKVYYKGLSDTFTVKVEKYVEVEMTSISINTLPTKLRYTVGEQLNTSGLVINQNYSDGTLTPVYGGFTCSPTSFTKEGVQAVTVSYNGFTCTYNVFVSEKPIRSVEIGTMPVKTEYYQRDTLDTEGLTLKVTYTDDTFDILTGGFTCTPEKLENTGKQTVKVDLFGLYDTFEVDVTELSVDSATVITDPDKLSYFVGDTFDATGFSLEVTYNNGQTEVVTEGFTVSPEPFAEAGTQTVTVAYLNKTFDFEVTVEEVVISKITVNAWPEKLEYLVNETLDTTGLAVTVLYNNGDKETVTEGFTCSPTVLTQIGEQKITVTYEGVTCDFYVWVEESIPISIKINSLPEKTVYVVGDTLDTDGLTLEVTYSDGSTEIISEGFECTPTEFIAASASQAIIVKYADLSETFYVTVNQKKISVSAVSIQSELVLYKNDEELLIATVTPSNADNKNVIWKSSDEDVAVVDENGKVTAVGRGTAIITATTEDGGITDTCKVTVKYTWWQWLIVIFLFGWIWY